MDISFSFGFNPDLSAVLFMVSSSILISILISISFSNDILQPTPLRLIHMELSLSCIYKKELSHKLLNHIFESFILLLTVIFYSSRPCLRLKEMLYKVLFKRMIGYKLRFWFQIRSLFCAFNGIVKKITPRLNIWNYLNLEFLRRAISFSFKSYLSKKHQN